MPKRLTGWRSWRGGILAGLLTALMAQGLAGAQSLEYPVKANFLVRFAAFAQWPPGAFATPETPIGLCVIGRDPFGRDLDRAASGQSAHGRPIIIRRMAQVDTTACHIAYLGQGAQPARASLTRIGAAPVLSVTDEAWSQVRGVAHFDVRENRVRFHIDQGRAANASIRLDSRLLSLAIGVDGAGR